MRRCITSYGVYADGFDVGAFKKKLLLFSLIFHLKMVGLGGCFYW